MFHTGHNANFVFPTKMKTSSRLRSTGESFPNRRGHGSQLSISDPSHHVTEAIGILYGDSDDDSGHDLRRDSRPLSFIASPYGGEQIQKMNLRQILPEVPATHDSDELSRQNERRGVSRTVTEGVTPSATVSHAIYGNVRLEKSQALPPMKLSEKGNTSFLPPLSPSSPLSPTLALRENQSESQGTSQFPLTNIDNPNDIAQELSNLQALRRMSMDVGNSADPDLVPFQGLSLMAMPSIAPSGEDDEGDISRLLWVPAKVHPELAPDQFKNFLEKRVQSIKRRSGDSLLAADSQEPRMDGMGLGRKKSMLSRQFEDRNNDAHVEGGSGFDDGAGLDWRLQSTNSYPGATHSASDLSLNDLVKDPSKIVQRLALDTQRQGDGLEMPNLDDDKPILPAPTMGLRRSTRTTYRKGGSLRSGDRVPVSKRSIGTRQSKKDIEREAEEPADLTMASDIDFSPVRILQPSTSEPVQPENSSLPALPATERHGTTVIESPAVENASFRVSTSSAQEVSSTDSRGSIGFSSHGEPNSHALESDTRPFPRRSSSQNTPPKGLTHVESLSISPQQRDDGSVHDHQRQLSQQPTSLKSSKRPSFGRPAPSASTPPMLPVADTPVADTPLSKPTNETVQYPTNPLGNSLPRADSSALAPTIPLDDKRVDKKARDKDDVDGGKSSGWKWFKSEDREKKKKEKEKDRGREKEKDDHGKKLRAKNERSQPEKAHDGARLDVLQSSIDSTHTKGRESLVIDRDGSVAKQSEEKKPDSSNRKVGDTKKEKDGFFGAFFGGSRRKESKDNGSGKGKHYAFSPEPAFHLLRPDIDYPYTRFPIVEERAIYRMAHMKLANPRRDLRSQVLLSNFMYSYLAKVQAMHPQLNVPTSPHQKRQEEERKRREQELQQQQYIEQQMMMQQQHHSQPEVDQYNSEYQGVGRLRLVL